MHHVLVRTIPMACMLAAIVPVRPVAAALPDNPSVLAVIACDPYADIKDQAGWVGRHVGRPELAGFLESFLLMATQFKGLAGLDTTRPLGVVVSLEGDIPAVHGFLPVKDLDRLLEALKGVVGPTQRIDGVRRLGPPGGMTLDVVERDGWAIVSRQDGGPAPVALAGLLEPLTKEFTLGVQAFPSRMPDAMRQALGELLRQAARMQAERGQPVDESQVRTSIEQLRDVESLLVGIDFDVAADRVDLQMQASLVPGSEAAALLAATSGAATTVATPPTTDGGAPAVRAHYAQTVPPAARAAFEKGLDLAVAEALAAIGEREESRPLLGVVRDVVAAMLDVGGIDAAMAVDTSGANGDRPLPAVTIGMRVKDAAALERKLRERLGKATALPPRVSVRFDAGTAGPATLHEITIDLAGLPMAERLGGRMLVTVATAPGYALVLTGGDVPKRVAAVLEKSGRDAPQAKAIAGIDVSLAHVLRYALELAEDDPGRDDIARMAKEAAGSRSSALRLHVRPVERGAVLTLSADAGAIAAVAAGTQPAGPPAEPAGDAGSARGPRPAAPALAP